MSGAVVLAVLVTVAAAAAGAAWLDRSSRSAGMAGAGAVALAGWAGLICLATILAAVPPRVLDGTQVGTALGWVLAVTAALLAVAGLIRLLPMDLTSVLSAVAAVTLVCGVAGIDASGGEALLALRPLGAAAIAIAALALLLRRGLDGWHAPGALAATAFAGAGLVAAARVALPGAAGWAGPVAAAATATGFAAAAAAAVIGPAAPRRRTGGGTDRMLAPALAASAIVAQSVRGIAGGIEAVGAVGVGLVGLGLVAVLLQSVRDATDLGADLDDTRARLDAVRENSDDVVLALDANGRVRTANAAVLPMLQRSPAALLGTDITEVARLEERAAVRELIRDVAHGVRRDARVELSLAPPAAGTAELRLRAVPGVPRRSWPTSPTRWTCATSWPRPPASTR